MIEFFTVLAIIYFVVMFAVIFWMLFMGSIILLYEEIVASFKKTTLTE